MATRLEEVGFIRTSNQIREKMKKLKQKYRKLKDNNSFSGRNRMTFKFYDKLDEILGDRPISRPPSVFESSQPNEDGEQSEDSTLPIEDVESQTGNFECGHDTISGLASSSPSPSQSIADTPDSIDQNSANPKPSTTLTYSPTPKSSTENVAKKSLPTGRGRRRKRGRDESFLSEFCRVVQKQQEKSDELFFKREEERQQKEMEMEVKRRKEEWEHEMMMMQMIGNMFNQMAASFNSFVAPMSSTSHIYNHGNFQHREMTQQSTS